jgi:hypothetical protein
VVVVVGLTLVDPVATVELNVPGEIEIVVAPLVIQFSVLLVPVVTLVGLAAKDVIEGAAPVPLVFVVVEAVPQPDKRTHASKISANRAQKSPRERLGRALKLLPRKQLESHTVHPSTVADSSLVIADLSWLLVGGTESDYWLTGGNKRSAKPGAGPR